MIALQIGTAINNYLKENPIGCVTGADGAYKMTERNRLIPEVGYISKERLPEIPQRETPVPPDLAVEVKSPYEKPRELHKKALKYLALGTPMVWIVYPEDRTVDVYRPPQTAGDDARLQSLDYEDALDGGDGLPNFTLPLNDIFPAQ